MIPSRRLPAWIAFAFLSFVGLCVRGAPLGAEEEKPSGGMAEPGAGDPGKAPEAPPEEDVIDDSEDGPAEFVDAVNKAIDKGVTWLKKKQMADGSWGNGLTGNSTYGGGEDKDTKKDHPAGNTSLALYTLLKCGVPANDPAVRRGFDWLKKKHKLPGGSYETSMLLLATTATADPFKKRTASEKALEKDRIKLTGEFRGWAQELQKHLIKKRQSGGGWRYQMAGYAKPPGGEEDLSSTQLACLALFAADRCGIKTESKIWNDMITYAMKQQEPDGPKVDRAIHAHEPKPAAKKGGEDTTPASPEAPPDSPDAKVQDRARGHAYILSDQLEPDEGQPTGGMTACGLGTIMMARFILMQRKDRLWEARDKAAVQQSVYDSAAWLEQNWNPIQNPRKASKNIYHLYYLYCVERAFDMIGNRRLGKHFWYVEMGQRLLAIQKPAGFWNTETTLHPQDTLDTCFALLFLKRATRGGIPFPNITGGSDEPPVDRRGQD
jgi:hypothetical protein